MNLICHLFALRLRAFFLCTPIVLLAETPTLASEQLVISNIQTAHPFQVLYQIEYNAAQFGWTADFAQQAGDLWQSLEDMPRAVAYWEVSVRLDPTNATLARHLAQGYIELQRWAQAVVVLNRVVELSDDNWSHFHLGLLQAAFNPQMATAHLQLAARDPQFETLFNELAPLLNTTLADATTVMKIGVVLAAHEHWDYAEHVFQYAASLVQPFPEALAYIGLARDRQGKTGTDFIIQAVTHAPDNAQVRYLQGLHLRLIGDEQGSLLAFQMAANIDSLNPAYAAELAFAYQELGSAVLAEYWFKAAVTLSNNDLRFQKLLDDFYSQMPLAMN